MLANILVLDIARSRSFLRCCVADNSLLGVVDNSPPIAPNGAKIAGDTATRRILISGR